MSKSGDFIKIQEMASLQPKDTGVSLKIWIDEIGSKRKGKHNTPRFKVVYRDEYIPISMEWSPKVLSTQHWMFPRKYLDEITKWIRVKNNLELLLMHWNQSITTVELFKSLNSIT